MADDQKVALVLGGIKGIGKGIGLDLVKGGIRVALTYYDWEELLPEMQRDFAETGKDHLIVKMNLLDTEKISDLVKQVVGHFGRLDILINNIERGGYRPDLVVENWNSCNSRIICTSPIAGDGATLRP